MRAEQVRESDRFELSDGHAIYCAPAGDRHGSAHTQGAKVLAADPAAAGKVGIDVGYAFGDGKYLRAPDVSVSASREHGPGWATSAPLLAVEYADAGQDEKELARKIRELFAAGTRLVWVVRLVGPLRVEVHEPGQVMRMAGADEVLTAPGILQNPVPVRALVDDEVADRAVMHSLLSREGYDSLEAVQARALARSLLIVLQSRGLAAGDDVRARIEACRDPELLARWIARAATAGSAMAVFAD
jgi:hypothetical protein